MAYNPKLLRVDGTGTTVKSAKVGLLDDVTETFKLTEVWAIPIDVEDVDDWIAARYTVQQLWDAGIELTGGLLEAWLSLYQFDDAIQGIEDDRDECDTDLTAIAGLSISQTIKDILANIVNRQRHALNQRERLIRVMVRVIRVLAPGAEEAPAE